MLTPDLWSCLDFRRPKLAFALLQRFNFRVRIFYCELPDYGEAWDKFTFILQEAPSRVLQIIFLLDDITTPEIHASLDLRSAPSLADLCIFFPPFTHPSSLVPAMYNMETPHLRHLTLLLCGQHTPWAFRITRSPDLRTLQIYEGGRPPTVDLIMVLETLKHLP
jgi:hypothetical protein